MGAPPAEELLGYLHEAGTPTSTYGHHPDRDKAILWAYAKGKRQADIAKDFGISTSRVGQVIQRWTRILHGQVGRVRRGEQQRQKTTAD
jgi:DNA-binding NarL/FixJ family response regulator